MRTATGLTLIALGAILAFAVTGHPSWLNIQIAGWVIMLIGVAGMLLPRRGYGWLRRRLVLRRGPGGRPVVSRVEEQRYPRYVLPIPGRTTMAASSQAPATGQPPATPAHAAEEVPRRAAQAAADSETAKRAVAEWEAAEEAAPPGAPRPAEEVVEEYVEE